MIDTSKLETTLHKGASITGDGKEADLFVYRDHRDGTGILTDGQNFYFAYNDLLSVGDQCPPGARFMTANEELVIVKSKAALLKMDAFVELNPSATEDTAWAEYKKEIALEEN